MELDAGESLEIEGALEIKAADGPARETVQQAATAGPQQPGERNAPAVQDAAPWPQAWAEPLERDAAEPDVSRQAEPAAPAAAFSETSRPCANFEPEKEDKIEFARRLSRLIPEGWVRLPHTDGALQAAGADIRVQPVADMQPGDNQRQFLIIGLGAAECAVPVENTTEIGMVPELTRVPNVPGWMLGIANLRGDIVSVVDIRHLLGMGPFDSGMHDRIVMLRSRTEDLCTAVIANRIAGMHYVSEEDIIMAEAGDRDNDPFISGVYEQDGRSIAVLDIESLLQSDDMQQFRAL